MKNVFASTSARASIAGAARKLLMPAVLASVFAAPLSAQTVAYNFSWMGTSGYSMLGNFSYDLASAGDGAVRDGEVLSLTFEGFLNNVSIGSNSLAQTQANFNFNFNTVTEQFFLGGNSSTSGGQSWNYEGAGLGFGAGDLASAMSQTVAGLGFVYNPTPLVATRATVPEPSTLVLMLLSLGALGVMMRSRSQQLG